MYFIRKKDLSALEYVRDYVSDRFISPEEREIYNTLCEFIAQAKIANSNHMQKKNEFRRTSEQREHNREYMRKYREKLKNK